MVKFGGAYVIAVRYLSAHLLTLALEPVVKTHHSFLYPGTHVLSSLKRGMNSRVGGADCLGLGSSPGL